MADIKVLEKSVWSKIAAGEVVEKPASIVKELIENSIDAGAKNITIEIVEGGKKSISITDDGCGIKSDQIEIAFLPHATSKLTNIEDLNTLKSMGFRGEALASISAVSKVELISKTSDEEIGHKIKLEGGEKVGISEIASNTGTKITVSDLFFNTPARAKFLRKTKTEENDITNYVEKLMLSHCDINFKYIIDSKIIYNTTNCSLLDTIYTIYGSEISSNMIEVNYQKGNYKVSGYVSTPVIAKSNRTYQSLFVNQRYCINSTISASIANAYETFLMKGKFPVYVLFLTMPQDSLDVNVHPNKLEVKFENSQQIYILFNNAVFEALSRQTHIKDGFVFNHVEPQTMDEKTKATTNVQINTSDIFKKAYNNDNSGISFQIQQEYEDKCKGFWENKQTNDLKFAQNFAPLEVSIEPDTTTDTDVSTHFFKPLDEKVEQVKYDALFSLQRKIIGVAFDTYIIVEEGDNLYFIDQHAAHERQLFDKFMAQAEANDIKVQQLLVPYIFRVNDQEYSFLEDNILLLSSYGFDISSFGHNTFKVNCIPMILNDINLKDFFDEILHNLDGLVKKPHEILRHEFATMGCKAAIKAGYRLSEKEINILLDTLKKENTTLLCPHGRPIVVNFDKKQLEKMFKRIV